MQKLGYRSTDHTDSLRIARKLLTRGFCLKGVPGFFINRQGDCRITWDTGKDGMWNGRCKGIDDWILKEVVEKVQKAA